MFGLSDYFVLFCFSIDFQLDIEHHVPFLNLKPLKTLQSTHQHLPAPEGIDQPAIDAAIVPVYGQYRVIITDLDANKKDDLAETSV